MNERLIEIAAGQLLEKFGAGSHKPGSGSASAFQGMLAAQMIRTVIDLTLKPQHEKVYVDYIPELRKIEQKIDERIYGELERLFQLDSEQFDEVIKLRGERDKEKDWKKKRILVVEAKEALAISTETPLEIAERCVELGNLAAYVFDHGFKSARGDSGVALNCAISAVGSCLSIIELNLISLPVNEHTESIRDRKVDIKLDYEKLSQKISSSLHVLEEESVQNRNFCKSIAAFRRGNLADSVTSNSDIEKIVRRLQNTVWLQRENIWKNGRPNRLQVLKPDIILEKVMGYAYHSANSLGVYEQDGDRFETAGLINKNEKIVEVSKKFSQEMQNFTAAHELGHAILHRQTVLHRDKPIDGSINGPRSAEEVQADKFATYFLMPSKLVEEVFLDIFETKRFTINEESVLASGAGSIERLRGECLNQRGLGRFLASLEYYHGKKFNPLTKIFEVSVETMAIRLEELDLLEF